MMGRGEFWLEIIREDHYIALIEQGYFTIKY